MADWSIAPLSRFHDREAFQCGDGALDEFLRRYARQNQEKGLSRTYVATLTGERRVIGYFTLSAGSVECVDLPETERRRLPKHPVPVVHLGRLAVDQTLQGQGLGEHLLIEAMGVALRASKRVGAFAVEVVAKGESARAFYAKYGFGSLTDDRFHMYLAMRSVERVLGEGTKGTSG